MQRERIGLQSRLIGTHDTAAVCLSVRPVSAALDRMRCQARLGRAVYTEQVAALYKDRMELGCAKPE